MKNALVNKCGKVLRANRIKIDQFSRYEHLAGQIVLATLSAVFVWLFLDTAFSRIDYPYDLEWMEGGAVDHTVRVSNGEALYVAPSLDFTPYIYTPLSYYLSSFLSIFTGEGYIAGRLLSILATLGCFILMYIITFKWSRSYLLSILPVGIFCACYELCFTWFDIGRVDSLFLFFLLLSAYYLLKDGTNRSLIISCVALYLSFMTKQSAILFYPMACLLVLRFGTKKFIWYSASLAVITSITILIYNSISDGWFYYYIFQLGQQHPIVNTMFIDFWALDLWHQFKRPIIIALIGLALIAYNIKKKHMLPLASLVLSLVGISYFGRLHSGGDANVLMPAFCGIALVGPIVFYQLQQPIKNIKIIIFPSLFTLYLGQQLWAMKYDPDKYIPTMEDATTGDELIESLKDVNGPIWISSHGYWQNYIGNKSNAHFMALYDILRGSDNKIKQDLTEHIVERIDNKYYEVIIQDNDFFVDEIRENYTLVDSLVYPNHYLFTTIAGVHLRPIKVYTPKD